MYVLTFWRASGCDYYFADAGPAQVLFEHAFGVV
jgi:hypothetical protein